jgi:hypothetical protein
MVDEELVKRGRLRRICSKTDLHGLPIQKKESPGPRRLPAVIDEVMELILDNAS